VADPAQPETPPDPAPPGAATPPKTPLAAWRLATVFLLIAGLWIAGRVTGISDAISTDSIRNFTADAGPWGWLAFIGIFVVGLLVSVPGLIFCAAGILAYGRTSGALLAYIGALAAITVSFAVVRAVGGQALTAIERPLIKRILARLDRRPILVVAILRVIFFSAPWLNYSLALTQLRFRDHLIGTAIGITIPVILSSVLFDWLFG
jgi:uncharacterized membrane protein YdjX (TVP38/TMEM64 family)